MRRDCAIGGRRPEEQQHEILVTDDGRAADLRERGEGRGVPALLTRHDIEGHDLGAEVRQGRVSFAGEVETPGEARQVGLFPELRAGRSIDGEEGILGADEQFGGGDGFAVQIEPTNQLKYYECLPPSPPRISCARRVDAAATGSTSSTASNFSNPPWAANTRVEVALPLILDPPAPSIGPETAAPSDGHLAGRFGSVKPVAAYGTTHRIFTEGQRLAMIARAAEGSMRDSQSRLDQPAADSGMEI